MSKTRHPQSEPKDAPPVQAPAPQIPVGRIIVHHAANLAGVARSDEGAVVAEFIEPGVGGLAEIHRFFIADPEAQKGMREACTGIALATAAEVPA